MDASKQIRHSLGCLEDALLVRASLKEAVTKSRILAHASFTFEAGSLRFTVLLKEVKEQPRFFTVRFDTPQQKAFIFTSFDKDGKKLFSKKSFKEMLSFLNDLGLAPAFEELVRSKAAELCPSSL